VAVRRSLDGIFFLVLVDWAVAAVSFVTSCRALGRGNVVRAIFYSAFGGAFVGLGSLLFAWWLTTHRR